MFRVHGRCHARISWWTCRVGERRRGSGGGNADSRPPRLLSALGGNFSCRANNCRQVLSRQGAESDFERDHLLVSRRQPRNGGMEEEEEEEEEGIRVIRMDQLRSWFWELDGITWRNCHRKNGWDVWIVIYGKSRNFFIYSWLDRL